jgi:hypothetical protein
LSRFCYACKQEKSEEEFNRNQTCCRECQKVKRKQWYSTHKDYVREKRKLNKVHIQQVLRNYVLEKKTIVLTHYGNGKLACSMCGFDDIRALSLDHINGGGNKHCKSLGIKGTLYNWLIKHNFPEGYQTLCMNCQFIKSVINREVRT